GWTVVTEDGSAACHIEWMVGVTGDGGVVLGR
ncbi:MAG: type I methionyl aminopeptidase, partial [Phycisphaeraceae bacterium]